MMRPNLGAALESGTRIRSTMIRREENSGENVYANS